MSDIQVQPDNTPASTEDLLKYIHQNWDFILNALEPEIVECIVGFHESFYNILSQYLPIVAEESSNVSKMDPKAIKIGLLKSQNTSFPDFLKSIESLLAGCGKFMEVVHDENEGGSLQQNTIDENVKEQISNVFGQLQNAFGLDEEYGTKSFSEFQKSCETNLNLSADEFHKIHKTIKEEFLDLCESIKLKIMSEPIKLRKNSKNCFLMYLQQISVI